MRVPTLLVVPFLATCAACSGGGGGSGGISGRVSSYAAPLPFARVMVVGEEPVETDLDGRFESDAPDPYDLVVEDPGSGWLYVFVGLTEKKPHVLTDNFSGIAEGSIAGTLTGGDGFPATPGTLDHGFAFTSNAGKPYASGGAGVADDQTGAFQTDVAWASRSTATGRFSALQWETGDGGFPESYTGFGLVEDVAVQSGAETANVNVTLSDIPEGSVSGTITSVPAGYEVNRHRLFVFTGTEDTDLGSLGVFSVNTTSSTFNIPTPAGDDIRVAAQFSARDPLSGKQGRTTVFASPLTAGLSVTIPGPVVFTSTGASVSLSEPMAWTPFEHDGVYGVLLQTTSGGLAGDPRPTVSLLTDDVTAMLPDLSPLGRSYGTGSRYLVLSANDTYATVDGYVEGGTIGFEDSIRHIAPSDFRVVEVTP